MLIGHTIDCINSTAADLFLGQVRFLARFLPDSFDISSPSSCFQRQQIRRAVALVSVFRLAKDGQVQLFSLDLQLDCSSMTRDWHCIYVRHIPDRSHKNIIVDT